MASLRPKISNSEPLNGPLCLEIQPPGTEFLDAETRG